MAHIIAFVIIAVIKTIKWTLIKSRLYIAAIPMAAVLIFFKAWYEMNTLLADAIGIALIAGVAVSWIISLVRYIKGRKRNNEMVLDWAYERYGTPIALTRKTQANN